MLVVLRDLAARGNKKWPIARKRANASLRVLYVLHMFLYVRGRRSRASAGRGFKKWPLQGIARIIIGARRSLKGEKNKKKGAVARKREGQTNAEGHAYIPAMKVLRRLLILTVPTRTTPQRGG